MAIVIADPLYKVNATTSVTDAWHAFDGNKDTKWSMVTSESTRQLSFDFGNPTMIKGVRFTPTSDSFPSKIELYGSNEDEETTLISTFDLTTPVSGTPQPFVIAKPAAWSKYIFELIGAANPSDTTISISEIEFLLPSRYVLPIVSKEPDLQEKTITPNVLAQEVTPDEDYDGLSKVTVESIPSKYADTTDATATSDDILSGKTAYVNGQKVTGTAVTKADPKLQTKTVSPSISSQTINPDSGYDGLNKVIVNAASLQLKSVTPSTSSQTIIPEIGYYGLSQVLVGAISLQSKSITPSTLSQFVTPSSGYQGLSSVSVAAIPSKYIDTSSATAAASDIASGKTAYVNGSLVTGTGTLGVSAISMITLRVINSSSTKTLFYSVTSTQEWAHGQIFAGATYDIKVAAECPFILLKESVNGTIYATPSRNSNNELPYICVIPFGTITSYSYPTALYNKTAIGPTNSGIGILFPGEDATITLS